MLKKFGVNSTRAEKRGPSVKTGNQSIERYATCQCGKKFLKTCASAEVCDVSSFKCPYCGRTN